MIQCGDGPSRILLGTETGDAEKNSHGCGASYGFAYGKEHVREQKVGTVASGDLCPTPVLRGNPKKCKSLSKVEGYLYMLWGHVECVR